MARKFVAASSQSINYGTPARLKFTRNFSVSCWFNINSTQSSDESLITYSGGGLAFTYLHTTTKMAFQQAGVANIVTSATTPTLGKWYQGGFTIDNNSTANVVLYINGVSDATGTTTSTFSAPSGNFRVATYDGSGFFFDGTLAEIAIWSGVLTANEMLGLAKGMPAYRIRKANLQFYSPLAGYSATEPDWSGLGGLAGLEGFCGNTVNSPTLASHAPVHLPFSEWSQGAPITATPASSPAIAYAPEASGGPFMAAPWQQRRPIDPQWVQVLPAPPSPTVQSRTVPEVSDGPFFGAPWQARRPIEPVQVRQSVTSADRPSAPPEVSDGPFMGAPWQQRRPIEPMLLIPPAGTLPPIIGVRLYAPEITGGPIFGAPWNNNPNIDYSKQVGAPPPPIPTPTYAPEIHQGPPLAAPWIIGPNLSFPSVGVRQGPPPGPPTPAPKPGAHVPFVPFDPLLKDARLRRHTEIVAEVLNSLMRQGFLQEVLPGQWLLTQGSFRVARAPGATDDLTEGANVGSVWIDTLDNSIWVCMSNVLGSAVWKKIA